MKKGIIASVLFMTLSLFSSCSQEKNTIGFRYYFNELNKTCSLGARVGFNYEEVVIPKSVFKDGVEYIVTGINANQKGEDKNINVDFLENNKFIKSLVIENDRIETLPWDLFRNSSLKYADLSKATALRFFGDHVFTDSKLEEISLPPNLYRTYKGVFSGTNLKSVTFPDTYEIMDIDTFFNCKFIEHVDLGKGMTYISGSAFERTPALKEVVCPSVTSIEQHALRETPNLESINLENVNYVGYMSFYKSGIKNVNLKNVFLESDCFKESKIETLTIEDCDEIPYKAFSDCKNLKDVKLNGFIYKIASSAFKNCNFETLTMSNYIKTIGSEAFYNCKNIKELTLPYNLTSISTNAFRKCSSLESVTFSSYLERIYDGAFLETKLKTVDLPKNVTLYGECFPSTCEVNQSI